jgi:hypothetical protein
MDHALATFGDEIGIAFSGGMSLSSRYAHLTRPPSTASSLPGHRGLNPETTSSLTPLRKRYGSIHISAPSPVLGSMDPREESLLSVDDHQRCCKCLLDSAALALAGR